MDWIIQNISTIIVGSIVAIVLIGVAFGMLRAKKRGKTSCCSGCSGCKLSSGCHSGNTTDNKETDSNK